jgi:hypothetical protein
MIDIVQKWWGITFLDRDKQGMMQQEGCRGVQGLLCRGETSTTQTTERLATKLVKDKHSFWWQILKKTSHIGVASSSAKQAEESIFCYHQDPKPGVRIDIRQVACQEGHTVMLVLWNKLGGNSDITLLPTRKADKRLISGMHEGRDCNRQRRHYDTWAIIHILTPAWVEW